MFGTGSLHDTAPVHLLTTATLSRLSELYPDGRFEVRRFRPNIVVEPTGDGRGFVENSWLKAGAWHRNRHAAGDYPDESLRHDDAAPSGPASRPGYPAHGGRPQPTSGSNVGSVPLCWSLRAYSKFGSYPSRGHRDVWRPT